MRLRARNGRLQLPLLLLLLGFLASPALRAGPGTETGTWTAGDGTGFSWKQAANWSLIVNGNPSSGYPNVTYAQVTIGNNVGISLGGTISLNTLAISGSTTLSNGTLVLGGSGPGITTTTGGTLVLSSNATLQLSPTSIDSVISTAAGSSVSLSNVTGTKSLYLSGSGTVTMTGTVNLGSTTEVSANGGTLLITGTAAVVSDLGVQNATVVISNGATVISNLNNKMSGTVTVTGAGSTLYSAGVLGGTGISGVWAIDSAATVTTGRVYIGDSGGGVAGSITVDGAGSTLDVTGTGAYDGLVVGYVSAGALAITDGGTVETTTAIIGYVGTSGINVGTVTVSGTGSVWNNTGALTIGQSSGPFNAAGTLTISDGGAVDTGTVTLAAGSGSQGTVDLEAGGTLATTQIAAASGTATLIFNGGTLQATGSSADFISNFTGTEVLLNSGGGTIDNNGYNITINSPLTGTGSATFIGSGTTTLTAANSYGGGTLIDDGDLTLGNGSTPGASLGSGGVTVSGSATLTLNLANGETFSNAITNNHRVVLDDSSLSNYTVSGDITGSGGVTKTGANTVTLSGNNSYTGDTLISGGTLKLGAADALPGGSAIVLSGGTLDLNGFSPAAFTNALTVDGAGSTIDFGLGHIGGVTLEFADSSSVTWTSDLTLLDFTVGTDELGFGSSTGLTLTQLADINLSGYTATGLDSSGFVLFAAVPEPTAASLLPVVFALIGLGLLKRRQQLQPWPSLPFSRMTSSRLKVLVGLKK